MNTTSETFRVGDHCLVLGAPFVDDKARHAVVVAIIHARGGCIFYKVKDGGHIGYARTSEMQKL